MPMFKTCTACKETFIAESPFIKLCPICNAKSQTTPAERAQRKTRINPGSADAGCSTGGCSG